VVVLSTEPFIPWELVHLKAPGVQQLPAEALFLAQLGLVRWLWGSRPPEQLQLRPGRVHYIIPDYPDPDWQLGQAATERAFVEEHLGATPIVAHLREVLALLNDPAGFDLLHFAGHGLATSDDIADAQVLLEGRLDQGQYVPEPLRATVVAHYLAADPHQDSTRPLVVLNACQTGRLGYQLASIGGFAEAFVDRGVGAFVSSLWSVGDTPARTFIETLYHALLRGQPMAAAVKAARETARRTGDATWLAYTVYAHPNAQLYERR
jgi:CHAT domain-containing protein